MTKAYKCVVCGDQDDPAPNGRFMCYLDDLRYPPLPIPKHYCQCGAIVKPGQRLCAECVNSLDNEYQDHQDTLASLRATL